MLFHLSLIECGIIFKEGENKDHMAEKKYFFKRMKDVEVIDVPINVIINWGRNGILDVPRI